MGLREALAIHSMDGAFLGLTGVSHCRKMGHRLGPIFWPVKCARQAGMKVWRGRTIYPINPWLADGALHR